MLFIFSHICPTAVDLCVQILKSSIQIFISSYFSVNTVKSFALKSKNPCLSSLYTTVSSTFYLAILVWQLKK